MAQKEIEMVLMRQLASYLAMPIFVVDPLGNLLYYNEPAEALLGRRFDETGELSAGEWSTTFEPTETHGAPIPPDELPLVVTLRTRRPARRDFWIRGLDGRRRHIAVTSLPLIGQTSAFLGAVAVFWEVEATQ